MYSVVPFSVAFVVNSRDYHMNWTEKCSLDRLWVRDLFSTVDSDKLEVIADTVVVTAWSHYYIDQFSGSGRAMLLRWSTQRIMRDFSSFECRPSKVLLMFSALSRCITLTISLYFYRAPALQCSAERVIV